MNTNAKVKEYPILFSGQMVRAILDGRKTQTRRIISDPPSGNENFPPNHWGQNEKWFFRDAYYADIDHEIGKYVRCPYGVVGEHLWVRETWATICKVAIPYCECETDEQRKDNHYIEYRADTNNDYPGDWPEEEARGNDEAPKWKPSIFMPREASRITLEIVNIRVERLKEITLADIEAEGTPMIPAEIQLSYRNDGYQRYKDFEYLWDSINAKRGYGWSVNPWVWVIEFKKI